jgi:hypothetical protein
MSVSYIIVMRNPSNRHLLLVQDDNEKILEFGTENEALETAKKVSACRAWGCEIVPIDRS